MTIIIVVIVCCRSNALMFVDGSRYDEYHIGICQVILLTRSMLTRDKNEIVMTYTQTKSRMQIEGPTTN